MTSASTQHAFFDAVRDGQLEDVARLLDASPELVSAYDARSFGATALNHACGAVDAEAHRMEMVDLLLQRGADIDQRSDWWAGSWGVLDSGSAQLADALLERGATLTAHATSRLGRLPDLKKMLDADPSLVRAPGGDGKQPLHFAGTIEVAELLLERGADIDARDLDHVSTPAQWLISERPGVARYLIDRGAAGDPVIATRLGDLDSLTGIDIASFRIDRSSFPSEEPAAGHIYLYTIGEGASLLHVAATSDDESGEPVRCISWLVEQGLDPNVRGSYDDATPLHQAAWGNHAGAVNALLDAGADPNIRSGEIHRNEPLGWAIVAGSATAVRRLIGRGAVLRDEHIEDARAGAEGRFRAKQSQRPLKDWQRIAEWVEDASG